MKPSLKQKIIHSSVGILIAILLFSTSGLKVPIVDTTPDTFFRESISRAGIAYATCRVINASVSIVKDSTLQLEPAGVGVSLAIGQALDPIDDMTERLSDVLVTAIASLGVQKLAYDISVSLAPPVFAAILLLLSVLIWFENERMRSFRKTTLRFLLLIAIIRFCLPISSAANSFLHHHFFIDRISEANEQLALASIEIDKLKDFSLPEIDGVLGTIESSTSFLKQKTTDLKSVLVTTVSNMGDIIENLLKLTFLYVGIFVIQVIILPLLAFWFLIKSANAIFYTHMPAILHHSPESIKSGPENKQGLF